MSVLRTLIAAALLLPASPVMAASSASYGKGGQFATFDPIVARHNQSGELFRIEGHCQSACTLFLAIKNVCVDPGANLLFHAGHNRNRQITAWATQHMLNAYNAKLRAYLTANHYMDTLDFHAISGRAMIEKFGYRKCPQK